MQTILNSTPMILAGQLLTSVTVSPQASVTLREVASFTQVAEGKTVRAMRFLVMGDGSLVALDRAAPEFFFFDEHHRLTHSQPHAGNSRGELLQPDQLSVSPNDWIAVRDIGTMRINVYDRRAELLMMAMMPERENFGQGQLFWIGEDLVYTIHAKPELDETRFAKPEASYRFEIIPGKVVKLDKPVQKPGSVPNFDLQTVYGEVEQLPVKKLEYSGPNGQTGHATHYAPSFSFVGTDARGRTWVQRVDPATFNFTLNIHGEGGPQAHTIDLKSAEIRSVRLYGNHMVVRSGYNEEMVTVYRIEG